MTTKSAERSGTSESAMPHSVKPATNAQALTWIVVAVTALVAFMLRAAIQSGLWNEFAISAAHVVIVGVGMAFLLREKPTNSAEP